MGDVTGVLAVIPLRARPGYKLVKTRKKAICVGTLPGGASCSVVIVPGESCVTEPANGNKFCLACDEAGRRHT